MKRAAVQAVKAVAGVALLVWLLIAVDIGDVAAALRVSRPSYIAAGLIVHTAAALIVVFRLQAVFTGLHIPFIAAMRLTMGGYLFNQLLPSGVGGDAYRSLRLKPVTGSWSSVIARLVFERASGALALLAPGAILLLGSDGAAPIVETIRRMRVEAHSHRMAAAVLVAVVAVLAAIAVLRRDRVAGGVRAFVTALRSLRPRTIAAVLALSGVHHALRICGTAMFFTAVGFGVSLRDLTICMAVTLFASLVPITIGALGVREGVFAYSLSLYGVPTAVALAVAILNRAVVVLFGIVGGLLFSTERGTGG